jgi:uncharacterized membrane protein YfcA
VEPARLALLGLAALLAAVINSVAGGGSLVSFPALLAMGVPPVLASATNTAALTPGNLAAAIAYRSEFGRETRLLAACAAVGGVVGAVVLVTAPPRAFELAVPWLVAGATLLLVFDIGARRPSRVGIALVSVYGGYFGAGIGMLVLALLGKGDLHAKNAAKCVIVASVNGAATGYFLLTGRVQLVAALVMAGGAILGGYGGAAVAKRVSAKRVRWVVVAIGVLLTLGLAVRYY